MAGTPAYDDIAILYPIPLNLGGPILQAFGAVWPGAEIVTDHPQAQRAMVLRLPRVTPKAPTKQALAKTRALAEEQATPETADVTVRALTQGEISLLTPKEMWGPLAQYALAALAQSEKSVNYVEQTLTLPEPFTKKDGETVQTLVLTCAWEKGSTPHELRMKAEARADRAEEALRAAEARATEAERRLAAVEGDA